MFFAFQTCSFSTCRDCQRFFMDNLTIMIIMEPNASSIWMSLKTWEADAWIFANRLQIFTVMSRTILKIFLMFEQSSYHEKNLKDHSCVFLPYARSCWDHHIQSGKLILFHRNIHDFLFPSLSKLCLSDDWPIFRPIHLNAT